MVGRKVVGPVALGLVVALAPSCRQLAGIHVVESQQAACSTCVDASCGPQSSTCLATASCATRLECALACDPTDGTCVPGCQAQPVGDADDLGAVEACIAKSCGSACELTWGGILPPVPPSAASACQACISAQCSAADQACAQSADCSTGVECARSHSTPDTLQTCELGNPAAAPLYSALASCVEASCPTACAIGADWACVGKVAWPKPTADSVVGTVTVVNAADQSQALPGLSVMACFQGNLTCSPPASPAATTNANGTVQLTVPMSTQGGLDGFLGYIQITDPTGTYYPTNAFPGFPITQPLNSTVIDGTAQFAETIIQLTGTTYDPTRSSVVVTVEDCAGATGADASFSIEPSDAETKIIYLRNFIPDLSATATDSGGTAIIGNVILGQVTLTTRVAGVTPVVASTTFFTTSGITSIVEVTPTP
ncbi:MAG: hypothetical protein ACLQVI_09290 [Polyangiaceae bacterium]